MKINVYCKSKGWLFDDLKKQIAKLGAISSNTPIDDADAYICIRTNEAMLSPKPEKTVVQVHDMKKHKLFGYGIVSLVHESQSVFTDAEKFIQPIGSRGIPDFELPERPTIGFFARALNHENKGKDIFERSILEAKKHCDFDVLMIGNNLNDIEYLGEYEARAAGIMDYSRVSALFTASQTPMIPISIYEGISCGRAIVTTPRVFPFDYDGIMVGNNYNELSEKIVYHVNNYRKYNPVNKYTRYDWCMKQIELAKKLI